MSGRSGKESYDDQESFLKDDGRNKFSLWLVEVHRHVRSSKEAENAQLREEPRR